MVLDLYNTDSELELVEFVDELPFIASAIIVSPDQTKLAAAFDNEALDPEGSPQKSIVIWDLLTGDSSTVATVSETEFLAQETGPNTFGGAQLFGVSWDSRSCVRYMVFVDDELAERAEEKKRSDVRTACLDE
jgi:hypothetical protein